MAESVFPFKTPGMSWGLASAKLDVSQKSAIGRKLFKHSGKPLLSQKPSRPK